MLQPVLTFGGLEIVEVQTVVALVGWFYTLKCPPKNLDSHLKLSGQIPEDFSNLWDLYKMVVNMTIALELIYASTKYHETLT